MSASGTERTPSGHPVLRKINICAPIPSGMKIVFVIGARPQYIKLHPLMCRLEKRHDTIFVDTGQHYDYEMSEIFLRELGLRAPEYNLNAGSGSHARQTGEIMLRLEPILEKEAPDLVVVVGDTNSTLAGALTSVKMRIPVAHVEAGLRRFDLTMPEEVNRVVSDHVSDLLFAPTEIAMKNLEHEGLGAKSYLVGDVMYDTFLAFRETGGKDILDKLGLPEKGYTLATVHRACNTDIRENLESILQAFEECGKRIVFPMHPRTKKMIDQFGLRIRSNNVLVTEPVGYLEMLCLEMHARKIITDSGGVQKEAYLAGVPCITLLTFSEWVETVECGWNFLAGTDKTRILWALEHFEGGRDHPDLFGDGHAAEKIVRVIEEKIE